MTSDGKPECFPGCLCNRCQNINMGPWMIDTEIFVRLRDQTIDARTGVIRNLEAENTRLRDELKARTDERDDWRSEALSTRPKLTDLLVETAMLCDELAARDARIAELDTLLAERAVPVPDTPKPAHDWTRVDEGDRRRIGS